MRKIMALIGLCMGLALAHAGTTGARAAEQPETGPETKLPMPRYVSLRSGKVNLRRGPGLDYRIDWVFQRAGMPVRVIDEYGHWRRISDSDDAVGWVYHALLTSRRMALVTETRLTLRAEPNGAANPTAHAEQGVVAQLLECATTWCLIAAGGAEGWVPKQAIWGVDPGEEFGG